MIIQAYIFFLNQHTFEFKKKEEYAQKFIKPPTPLFSTRGPPALCLKQDGANDYKN